VNYVEPKLRLEENRLEQLRIQRASVGISGREAKQKDIIVATESDLRKYGDNFSLIYYPALREGREIYVAS
jgi:hypothetical protein